MTRVLCPLAALLVLLVAPPALAGPAEARWIRTPAIAPDGEQVVFSYAGDLWVVATEGGRARPLTTHVGHERSPVWSPDGEHVAFASDRHGNFDVFVIAAAGGRATRLTYHSSDDVPSDFSPDGQSVVFSSARLDSHTAALGSAWWPELYAVPLHGGRPRQLLTTPALRARYRPDGGRLAYEDLKGYENEWRKHHRSPVTRDLWTWDPATGAHRRLTSDRAEDRNPCWSADGKTLFFLSERSGSFEVWKRPLESEGAPEPVTALGPHPVRFLTAARDGTLAFTYHGDLFVKRPGAEPSRVRVTLARDERTNPAEVVTLRKGATELAVAPSEKEVAFVVRGEVFVASVEHGTTKRVTDTPEQERSVSWAPDGLSLYYAGERGGSWNLYRASLGRPEEKHFFRATRLEETVVLADAHETFQPVCSPDGKHLAYVRDRDEIAVLDLESGAARTLVPAERNYSYVDGDIDLAWSPDSRWLAFTMMEERRWIGAVGVVDVASGRITNVTRSGYEEGQPRWGPDGRVLTFASNRHGRRSHASWGSEADVLGLYLTRAAFDRARLSEEEYDLLREEEKKKERKDRRQGGGEDEEDEDDAEEENGAKAPPPVVEIDLEGLDRRLRRLTIHSAPLGDHALSPDGETLVYVARVGEAWGLWVNEIREAETRRVLELGDERPGELFLAKNGKAAFLRRGNGTLVKVEIGGREGRRGPAREDDGPRARGGEGRRGRGEGIEFQAEMVVRGPEERAHLFEHVWRQVLRKFYDPTLHGVDWEALKGEYAAFLPHVADGRGFAELLSEMLGELNASHTGARYRPRERTGAKTAALGLLYDVEWDGDGLRVAEVLPEGPADRAASRIRPGATILAIDGVRLDADVNPWPRLDRKERQPVLLTLQPAGGGEVWEEVIRPVTLERERNLLYERWVRSREAAADRLSDGRVGYVHVRGMGDRSFRRVFRDALGKHGAKEALVVDTRFNGGGWMHDDLVSFLEGRDYAFFVPRGKEKGAMGAEPHQRWSRPVAVIQNEANYSDAHFFPYAFRTLGLGKLVGAPVAGTATAVWWERLIDPAVVFGIPQVGMVTPDGRYLENLELAPDVEVANDPASVARGEDRQLEAAVRVLLEAIED